MTKKQEIILFVVLAVTASTAAATAIVRFNTQCKWDVLRHTIPIFF